MALINNLMVRIGVASDGVRRGVNRANRELDRMRNHARRVSREMGRSGSDGGEQFGEGFWRDANGRLHDSRGRFARAGRALGGETGKGFSLGFGKLLRKAAGKLPDVFRAAAPVAAIGSAIINVLPLMPAFVSGAASLGSAALAAAPALIALAAGGLIVKKALGAIFAEGSAARKALEPLAEMFSKAGEAGSKAAAKGIRPLAEALRRAAAPQVVRFMETVGKAANRVQRDFLKWAKSADGIKALRGILDPLSASLVKLSPHISRLVISFARMLGRIMGVSTALGQRGLAGALDWLSKRMDAVDAKSVAAGLSQLKDTAVKVAGAFRIVGGWLSKLYQAYKTYTTQFALVADALAVVAMIFGGPIVTAIAAAGLIIRHFDQIKAAWLKLKSVFSGQGTGPIAEALQNLKAAAAIVTPALVKAGQQIWAAVWPKLKEIWAVIKNDLIPALGEFALAIAPVVAWLVGKLGPVVATVFAGVLNVIKGALNIIVGIIQVFTGVLNGDWSKVWEGLKTIAKGFWQILSGVVRAGIALIVGQFRILLAIAGKIWNQIWGNAVAAWHAVINGIVGVVRAGVGKVKSVLVAVKNGAVGIFRGAGSWLVDAGRSIIHGLVSGIESAIGKVKSTLNKVTGLIPDWKGPMRVDRKLLVPTGRAIIGGLETGITRTLPRVRSVLQDATTQIRKDQHSSGKNGTGWFRTVPRAKLRSAQETATRGVPRGVRQTAQSSGCACEIVVKSGGSRFDDALVEILRRAIRDKGGNVQKVLGK